MLHHRSVCTALSGTQVACCIAAGIDQRRGSENHLGAVHRLRLVRSGEDLRIHSCQWIQRKRLHLRICGVNERLRVGIMLITHRSGKVLMRRAQEAVRGRETGKRGGGGGGASPMSSSSNASLAYV